MLTPGRPLRAWGGNSRALANLFTSKKGDKARQLYQQVEFIYPEAANFFALMHDPATQEASQPASPK